MRVQVAGGQAVAEMEKNGSSVRRNSHNLVNRGTTHLVHMQVSLETMFSLNNHCRTPGSQVTRPCLSGHKWGSGSRAQPQHAGLEVL